MARPTSVAGRHCSAEIWNLQFHKVNMQFGGATSRDFARQADQYELSLALLHQGARLLTIASVYLLFVRSPCGLRLRGGVRTSLGWY